LATRPARGGRGTKLEYVQFLASALCHLIGGQHNQVGPAILADSLARFLPSGGRPGHIARLFDEIEAIETVPVTRLERGLRDLYQRLGQRGVLVVRSDFLVDDPDDVFGAIRLLRHRHFEVILLQRQRPDFVGDAARAFPWLPWADRVKLFRELLAANPGSDQFRQMASHFAEVRDTRTVQPLWDLTTRGDLDPQTAYAIDNALRRSYLGTRALTQSKLTKAQRLRVVAGIRPGPNRTRSGST
jgi:hypothetical protein